MKKQNVIDWMAKLNDSLANAIINGDRTQVQKCLDKFENKKIPDAEIPRYKMIEYDRLKDKAIELLKK